MNERIQELAKQTGYIWHASGDPQIYEFTPEKLEKFAELIVRECVKVMYDDAIERRVPPDINQTPTHYAISVLEHFGVVEQ